MRAAAVVVVVAAAVARLSLTRVCPQVWFAFFCIIYIAFYFFTSPFVGNPELLNSWTPYVYLSMGLYGWLVAAAALHIPVNSLGQLGSTIKQPVRNSAGTPQ